MDFQMKSQATKKVGKTKERWQQSVPYWLEGVMTDSATKKNHFYILSSNSGKVFEVDQLAAEFCENVDGRSSVADLLKQLAVRHRIQSQDIQEEARALVIDLKKNKLIGFRTLKKANV